MAFALGFVLAERDPHGALQRVSLASHMLDHDVAEFLCQRRSPFLGAGEVLHAEEDIEDVRSQGPSGRDGEGLVVQFAAELAGNFHGFHPGTGSGGEDAADGFFDAALNLVEQSHGPPPSVALTRQLTVRGLRPPHQAWTRGVRDGMAFSGPLLSRYYWAWL